MLTSVEEEGHLRQRMADCSLPESITELHDRHLCDFLSTLPRHSSWSPRDSPVLSERLQFKLGKASLASPRRKIVEG